MDEFYYPSDVIEEELRILLDDWLLAGWSGKMKGTDNYPIKTGIDATNEIKRLLSTGWKVVDRLDELEEDLDKVATWPWIKLHKYRYTNCDTYAVVVARRYFHPDKNIVWGRYYYLKNKGV